MPGTKIVVIQRKQVLFSAVLVVAGILFIAFLIVMMLGKKGDSDSVASQNGDAKYQAGVYTKDMEFGESTVSLQVSLDANQVKAVEIVPLNESVTTMYPLMEPAVKTLSDQLASGVAPENIEYGEESRYTQESIMEVVDQVLEEHKLK